MHTKRLLTSGRPMASATLLAVLAGSVVLIPSSNAVVPGAYGTVDIQFTANAGGYPGGVNAIADVDPTWMFGSQMWLNIAPKYMTFQVQSGPNNGDTLFGYCGDISKFLNPGNPTVTYEWVPLENLGYYSTAAHWGGVPSPLPSASSLFPDGIGVQKARLLQILANGSYASSSTGGGASDTTKAAFQLAIWKIVSEAVATDTKVDLLSPAGKWLFDQTGGGAFDGITADYPGVGDLDFEPVMSTAQTFLSTALGTYNGLGESDPIPQTVLISALTAPSHGTFPDVYDQDLLLFGQVPEPGTYAMVAGLGLVSFGLYRRLGRKA